MDLSWLHDVATRLSRTKFPQCLLFWSIYTLWAIFVLSSVAIGSTYVVATTPMRFLFPKAHRKYAEFVSGYAWPSFVYSLEVFGKNKVFIYTDQDHSIMQDLSTFGTSNLVKHNVMALSNHTSYVDWLMTFLWADRNSAIGQVKIIVKNAIKYIPFVGLALQSVGCVFLSRHWEKDQVNLKKAFGQMKAYGMNFWLLTHPEGSRFTPEKRAASIEYAKKKDLPLLNHLLLPRVKGFVATMTALRDSLDTLYDLTIAYSSQPSNFWVLFSGIRPIDIHIHIRRYKVSDLPKTDQGLCDWLYDLYKEKDELLSEFHEHNRFIKGKLVSCAFDHRKAGRQIVWWTICNWIPLVCITYLLLHWT